VENAEGKRRIEENGGTVLKGNKQGHGQGEWTYIGSRGETATDYRIVNEKAWERVEEFRMGERVESDHLETALRMRRGGKKQRRRGVRDTDEKGYFWKFLEVYFMFSYVYVYCN
jgi:hypothetical protein